MKKKLILLNLALFFELGVNAQTPLNGDQHWILNTSVSDEFSYTGTHSQVISQIENKWHFIETNGNKKVYDANWNFVYPQSFFTDDGSNIELANGVCEIYAKYQPGQYPWPCGNCWGNQGTPTQQSFDYTNGMLISDAQTSYGFYEVRVRFPYFHNQREKTRGVAPSFWFFSDHPKLPANTYGYGEIDVFEQVDNYEAEYPFNNNDYCFAPNIHFDQINGNNGRTQNVQYGFIGWRDPEDYKAPLNYPVSFADGQFHVIGFEWQKNYVSFYVDGNEVGSLNFEQDKLLPMNAYLNNGMTEGLAILAQTIFPFKYEIDYYRFYEFADNPNPTPLVISTSNYSNITLGFDKRLNITIGGSGLTAKVATGTNLVLRADENIILDEGFEIDDNTQMYLQVTTR
jgi:hypothetical protein